MWRLPQTLRAHHLLAEMSLVPCRRMLRLYTLHKTFLRALSTTSSTEGCPPLPSSSSFAVQFLTTSCGLTPAQALSAALTVRIDEKTRQQPESVLALFKSHGFSETQIAELVARSPRILLSRVEQNLGPKLQFLTHEGVSSELIARDPNILMRSLDRHIRPCFDFFRCLLGSVDDVHTMVQRHKRCLSYDLKSTMIPNVTLLLEVGAAVPHISKLMVTQPGSLLSNRERFAEIVQMVQDWGLKPERGLFLHAVRAMCGMGKSTLAAKLELFKKLGWSEKEVISAFRRCPLYILVSEQKITCINSFARKLDMGPSDLSRYPILLMYSFDKRILPRYAVWRVLTSKGLITHSTDLLVSMLTITEKLFLGRYVMRFTDKVPELKDVYHGKTQVALEGFDLGGEQRGKMNKFDFIG